MRSRLTLAIALAFVCTTVLAQHDHAQHDHGVKKPGLDPAMMAAMEKAGTPGEEHKKLDAFTGSWDTKVTFWPVPGADPMTMNGTSEARWIMGGRAIEEKFKGSFMGQPFEGMGYSGYDNVRKAYWATWMDNMSTGFFLSTGTADGNSWTYSGMMPDPMSGKDVRAESRVTVKDANTHVMEMWGTGPDGKMFKNMEMVYTRRK
jgi:hypothetical protein